MEIPQSDQSFLLALPMELLDRIAIELEDDHDAVLSTRLTCKTLEAATFDRFAEKSFRSREYCVLYKRSLLRLQDLLNSSSRLAASMRCITFTSSLFANTNYKQVNIALNQNQTNLMAAQDAAMDAYAHGEVERLPKQWIPDAEVIRCLLVTFKEKCPGVPFQLKLLHNVGSSISVHTDVLEAVASSNIALIHLSIDLDSLHFAESSTLLPGLLSSTSSLISFCFTHSKKDDGSEARRELLVAERYSVLRSVLRSANALIDLTLGFARHKGLQSLLQLTSGLLVASMHPRLQSLCLAELAVTEESLLRALAGWGRRLRRIGFYTVYLSKVRGEGWSDVLGMLTTMPRLCETRLFMLYAGGHAATRAFVDLQHLKSGEAFQSCVIDHRPHSITSFRNRDEVTAGLQELLGGGLKYY
jgi:hypothetical protein